MTTVHKSSFVRARKWKWFLLSLLLLIIGLVGGPYTYLSLLTRNLTGEDDRDFQQATAYTVDDRLAQQLYRTIKAGRHALGLPSVQVSVITRNGQRWSGSVGFVDHRTMRAAQVGDLYHVGSITKMYTAVTVLRLVQDGRLSLEDPVAKFIPGVPNGDHITIRHLLNHTSGLNNFTESASFVLPSLLFRKTWSPQEVLSILREQGVRSQPGERYFYSNTNYVLLGLIAARVSGQSFVSLLRQSILKPLGLSHTFFVPQDQLPTESVSGYDTSMSGLDRFGLMIETAWLRTPLETGGSTAAAIVANSSDVSWFTYQLFTGGILSEEMKKQMTAFIPAPDEDVPMQTGYGLGLRRLVVNGVQLWGHTGTFPGFSNVSFYAPKYGYVITVLSNLSMLDMTKILGRVQAVLLERPGQPVESLQYP
jgi:D-alanyl-D-alanine carboxypeptidase